MKKKTVQAIILVAFLSQTLVSGASLSGSSSYPDPDQNKPSGQTVKNEELYDSLMAARTTEEQTDLASTQPTPQNSSRIPFLDIEFITPIEPEKCETETSGNMNISARSFYGIMIGSILLIFLARITCYSTKKEGPNVNQNVASQNLIS